MGAGSFEEESLENMPAIALPENCLLPEMVAKYEISRLRSRKAAKMAVDNDSMVFIVTQKDATVPNPTKMDLYQMGTIARIRQRLDLPGDHVRLVVEGKERAQLVSFVREFPYLYANVERLPVEPLAMEEPEAEAYLRSIRDVFQRYAQMGKKMTMDQVDIILRNQSVASMAWQIARSLPLTWKKRQAILDCDSEDEVVRMVYQLLVDELRISEIQQEIQMKTQSAMEKSQREYVLREQMKVIRAELGEEGVEGDADRFEKRLKALEIGNEEAEKIQREINRFRRMVSNTADAAVMRSYLETLLDLPWNHRTEDSKDLGRAWQILQSEHYGLKDVKERVMEFLAVRCLTGGSRSPILCLVGPPGTGKTSVAKSIAEALDKRYVRVSLGGVGDEAQVRGHRRTYVGALPGDITVALRQAKCSNPLMLLDEIDKTSYNHRGDVASALLEVLDPEQNAHFLDHYVDIPQDLSQVLFLATANDMGNIPKPLLDRMEVVEIPGYTANEKVHIAQDHLIPKQLKENGLTREQMSISEGAIRQIINLYTKEAGVRTLERTIGKICRKVARMAMESGDGERAEVTEENLVEYLGNPRYDYLMANQKDEVGICRGLAWTQVGGVTMEIEVNVMPGKGELLMTGQLGDVMKESAKAGITFIRSIADEYGVSEEFFSKHDLHVHIPEGAVPKDGPSAGITMATAMLSAITGRPVRADLAMTGEITLRGRVLRIGGLKEKLLAAKYAQITRVLVPASNRLDVEEMDEEITSGLDIVYVSSMNDVIPRALV